MAGTTGLEPMASAVTVLPAMKEGMKRSERKLHPRNGPTQLSHPPTWVYKRPFAPTCKGLDAGVTSQTTSQISFARTFGFRPDGWPFLGRWDPWVRKIGNFD